MESTVNTILTAISSFYRYHNQRGNTSVHLMEPCNSPSNRHKSLLYHIYKNKPLQKRIISLKQPKNLPKTLLSSQIIQILDACTNVRDKFLVSLLYESGLRIGQALSLRHVDIKTWDNEIHVIFRKNNLNQVRSKSMRPNVIHVSIELMQLYSEYITSDYYRQDSEYVFINYKTQKPLGYGAIKNVFIRLSQKTALDIRPHMLRHTHATELIRSGWDPSFVQKRLGHAHVQTTIDTYTHINQDDLKRAFQEYQAKRKKPYIVRYLEYLSSTNLGVVTRKLSLVHLRTFHGIVTRENWLQWPKEPLIYPSDYPKEMQSIPKFIPEFVISQLQKDLKYLPGYMQRFITILLETGRRISEICTLPYHCLEQDDSGDYFLRIMEKKLKKEYLIPISDACILAIQLQQQFESGNESLDYLFPTNCSSSKTPHISARNVHYTLNNLAQKCHITDEHGKTWHFHAHQFRHTVGTRMINSGVPQVIVQRYLGHESAEMTARYAHLHDETLKTAFNEYQGKLVDIHGKMRTISSKHKEVRWLQHNIMAQALPNGLCALPLPQQRCPHANACLTCTHFCTHSKFLPQHQTQLEETNRIIDAAKTNGWQRQLEMNLTVKKNLEKVITLLQEEDKNGG